MKKIEIAIPVIVGSNGKWCTLGDHDGLHDWSFMSGALYDLDEPDSLPLNERRYIVRAIVEIPDEVVTELVATSVEEVE
jgi:hypothetical protein